MRIFFDTEFTGLRQDTTLISIGCIAENGRTFYAECIDYDRAQVDSWIEEHVLRALQWPKAMAEDAEAHFWFTNYPQEVEGFGTRERVGAFLADWLKEFGQVEMWSDCLAYDWVLFCQLFGGALNLPSHIYYIPFDLSTLLKANHIDPDISREKFAGMDTLARKHNALWDARVIKGCWDKMEAAQ